ncbi:hypothetical protein BUALT_Bualt03G0205900 [Buddleja alternifolia]|uniref:Phytocyanin domain-containing protein n=1 Tax=Buddleja alternifolia TaxID=168488 RepID=A0AAV6Y2Q1_9LAMI|nr:hypothetical protein BUALT_Bualt03G0205900 [Buddleja alternifolia]
MEMKMLSAILLSLATIAMSINLAMAANYTVGGTNGGWDQSTDIQTWASGQTFLAGDNLIFQYTINHDVTEVSRADFDSCTASNPLQPPHSGGLTLIPLTSTGTRYFICGTGGHCLNGMKVEIDTLPAASAPPPSTTPSLPPPAPPSTPSVPSPPPATVPSIPSPPPRSSVSPPVSAPKHSHSPAPKVSPSSPPLRAGVSTPTLPPAIAPPSGSLLSPPPSPSSADKFNVLGALTACSGFLIMMFFKL